MTLLLGINLIISHWPSKYVGAKLVELLSNSSLSPARLGVDFVLPLSQQQEQQEQEQQEQEQQEQQEPPPKISAVTDRILMKL